MKPSELIADVRHFTTGTLARNSRGIPCGTASDSGAVAFDCLGAFLWCYPIATDRRPADKKQRSIAKELFALCEARFDHRMLGKLDHAEALDLLRSVGI